MKSKNQAIQKWWDSKSNEQKQISFSMFNFSGKKSLDEMYHAENGITIRKNVKSHMRALIPEMIEKTRDWLFLEYCKEEEYFNLNLWKIDFIFSTTLKRSRYFRNDPNEGVFNAKYTKPVVQIDMRNMLYLYDMKSLKIKETTRFVGWRIQTECALIHEMTHHLQYELGRRKGSELETTKNELEYLKKYYPEHYDAMMN